MGSRDPCPAPWERLRTQKVTRLRGLCVPHLKQRLGSDRGLFCLGRELGNLAWIFPSLLCGVCGAICRTSDLPSFPVCGSTRSHPPSRATGTTIRPQNCLAHRSVPLGARARAQPQRPVVSRAPALRTCERPWRPERTLSARSVRAVAPGASAPRCPDLDVPESGPGQAASASPRL